MSCQCSNTHTPFPAEPGDWRSAVLEVRWSRSRDVAFYSRVARVYEAWAFLTERKARREVIKHATIRDGEDILEIATGTGAQLVALAQANPRGRTVGVEFADGMLKRTRARLKTNDLSRVEIQRADALALPLSADSFDLVVNSFMLDLLPREDIPRPIAEMSRVLRPGGRLVLSNMTKAQRCWHRAWDALYARGLSLTANCRGILAAPVLREQGFTDIERDYLSQASLPIELIVAHKPATRKPHINHMASTTTTGGKTMSTRNASDAKHDEQAACCTPSGEQDDERLNCTANDQEIGEIGKLLASVASHSLTPAQRTVNGYRLRLARCEDVAAMVHEFVRRDKSCCAFLDFSVHERADEILLDVTGPPEAGKILDLCFAVADTAAHTTTKRRMGC